MDDFLLRDMKESDLRTVWGWRNKAHIRKHMYNDKPIAWEDHLDWFKGEKQNPYTRNKLFLKKSQPLGVVRFTGIDLIHETCYWGFYIGEKEAPKGTGTMMGKLALDFIFSDIPLRKVCAEVLGFNTVSVRYHEKLGFVKEGRLRQQIKRDDQFIDVILMGLFWEQWEFVRKTLERGVGDRGAE